MTRPSYLVRGLGGALATALSLGIIACTTAAVTTTPITGITILADSITEGHGCGTGAGQVYKYAAVATNPEAPTSLTYGNVFDCFSDGFFPNLPAGPDGGVNYSLTVGAFDYPGYQSSALVKPLPDAGTDRISTITAAIDTATYKFDCSGTQESSVAVLAACTPKK